MPAVGFILIVLSVWLIDSAVRNRAPIQTLKNVLTTGALPQTGVTNPSTTSTITTPNTGVVPGSSNVMPGSNQWQLGTNQIYGTTFDEPGFSRPSGTVDDWISQANSVLTQNGDPGLSGTDVQAVRLIIQNESGGDPLIVNGWDSNATAGHPSKGLMQDIDSTFQQWAVSGHHNIFNPIDNIVASVRYARARYGSLSQVPGVEDVNSGGGYVGY